MPKQKKRKRYYAIDDGNMVVVRRSQGRCDLVFTDDDGNRVTIRDLNPYDLASCVQEMKKWLKSERDNVLHPFEVAKNIILAPM